MKLGLSSYTYGWAVGVRGHEPPLALDEHGLLDKCREHDVKLLQIGDNLPLHSFDDGRLMRLARRAASEGVQLEVGARGLTVKRIAQYAAIARRLGATLIRIVIDEEDYHPAPDEIIGTLRTAEPGLEGLTLGIENHDRFPAATLRSITDAIFSDRIGVCLDTANSLGAGEDIVRVASVLAPVTVNLHVKDFAIERVPHGMGFTVSGRPAGAGILDLPSVLRRIEPFGRCITAVLELWTPPELDIQRTVAKEEAWAAQSLEYLKPLFTTSA